MCAIVASQYGYGGEGLLKSKSLAMVNNGKNEIFTTGDVMRYCHVSRSTVLKWIKSGQLDAYSHPGGQYRLTKSDLLKFLRAHGMPIDKELV